MDTIDYQNVEETRRETPGFLRSLFGPGKMEVWRQLADQIGGTVVDGGFFGRDKVVATTGQWAVTLDTFSRSSGKTRIDYTRLRAPYCNADGFRFEIYRADLLSWLAEAFGLPDIHVGDNPFDRGFVVKATHEAKIRELLTAPIRNLLLANADVRLEVKDDEGWFGTHFPDGVDELHFVARGVIKDVALLQDLFEMFSTILHQLCVIGSAYENDPGVKL